MGEGTRMIVTYCKKSSNKNNVIFQGQNIYRERGVL